MIIFLGIGGEGHADHVNQRHNIEYQNTDAWQRHQGDVQVLIKERPDILSERLDMDIVFSLQLQTICLLDLHNPQENKSHDHKTGHDPGQKNQL